MIVQQNNNGLPTEIRDAATCGLDDDWHLIAVELRRLRARHAPATAVSIHSEFATAAEMIALAFNRRFAKFLEICRSLHVRPKEVVEPTMVALRELIQQLQKYGQERALAAGPFGQGKLVKVMCEEAVEFTEGALTQAYILASWQGIACNTVIYDPADWPPLDENDPGEALTDLRSRHASAEPVNHPTAASHQKATQLLAEWLKANPQMSKSKAREMLREAHVPVSATGFHKRVWPEARERAELPRKAPPGKKTKRLGALSLI